MPHQSLPLDSFLSHLSALPGRIPAFAEGASPLPAASWWPAGSPDALLAAAMVADLGPLWTGYETLSPMQRRLAAFLVDQDAAAWHEGLMTLAGDLASGRTAQPEEDARAREACEDLALRHGYVLTVFQALFEARSGLAMPAWPFASLHDGDAPLQALALDLGRRTRLPLALAAHFHHRLEVASGTRQEAPRFDEIAAILVQHGATAP